MIVNIYYSINPNCSGLRYNIYQRFLETLSSNEVKKLKISKEVRYKFNNLLIVKFIMIKALVMFSGWLDGLLAIKVLEQQWIDCTALTFTTPFFGKNKAQKQAEKFGIKFMSVDITDSHFEVLKNPKYWYGRFFNPCIDCHGFMFKIAWEIADKQWFNIIASGEVLWQRPMSQNKIALFTVRKLAWRDILRPLSAKLLEATSYEKEWLVDREQLLKINWRWRLEQFSLAKKFWLENFSAPGGWCILTESWYTDKLKLVLKKFPNDILPSDAELLKYGRLDIFDRGFVVMWRDDKNNNIMIKLMPKNNQKYIFVALKDITWPICFIKIIKESENIKNDMRNLYKKRVNKLKDLADFELIYN